MNTPSMSARPFAGREDIFRVSDFLLETYRLNERLHNWEPRRWQGKFFHRSLPDYHEFLTHAAQTIHLWQAGATLAGVVVSEYAGGVFLQIHPDRRALESEMLDWAESHLSQEKEGGGRWLELWIYDYDAERQALAAARGYHKTGEFENVRRNRLSLPLPEKSVPDGYRLRTMQRTPEDCAQVAALLNAAFNRTFHAGADYEHFQTAPIYRLELDIVVEAAGGRLVANAGVTCHEAADLAIFEPVCTHPDHQGRGLAAAAIAEGLRRLYTLGVRTAYVGAAGDNPASNRLYERLGFTEAAACVMWKKEW